MTARRSPESRLKTVARSALGWLDDVAKGRRELAQVRMELRETERLLSDQIHTNGRLIARQSWDTTGGAK